MNILLVRNEYIKKHHYTADYSQLSNSLKKLGHKVTLIGLDDKNKFEPDILLLKIPFNKRRYFLLELSLLLPIYCLIKKIKVVIVSNGIIPGTLTLILLKKILSINIIFDVRSIPVEEDIRWDYKHTCRVAHKWYDGATFISRGTKDFIEQHLNLIFKKYAIFSSAVNPDLFSNKLMNHVPDYIKSRTENKFVIFYHGSISPNRGMNLILDAIDQIKNIIPNILFVSVSEANDYITDYCMAKKYELKENLLLLNTVRHEEIASYINLADICIVPLPRLVWWEISSPLKLMEYLAMEKPIILSDILAHLSVVPPNSQFALYFNPDDPYDLGKKICQAINNFDFLKEHSAAGREIILNKYTWDIQAKILENFINRL